MEDPQDGPRGEIIEKPMVLQDFCSGVSVSLQTSSKNAFGKGLQKRNVMNDDADDDDADDDDGGDGDGHGDGDGDGDGGGGDDDGDDDDDVMVLLMRMVTVMRMTMMVKATGRRRTMEECGGVRKILRTVLGSACP